MGWRRGEKEGLKSRLAELEVVMLDVRRLLAAIHGDDGEYTTTVGLRQSIADAIERVATPTTCE